MRHYHDKIFWCQSGAGTTLGTKNSEGLYWSYCPLLFICVSGSRCPAITPKSIRRQNQCKPSTTYPEHQQEPAHKTRSA